MLFKDFMNFTNKDSNSTWKQTFCRCLHYNVLKAFLKPYSTKLNPKISLICPNSGSILHPMCWVVKCWNNNLGMSRSSPNFCPNAPKIGLIVPQMESDCPPNGTNLGLFKISFSTFWLGEPKCTEIDLKKSQICPIWGTIWSYLGATATFVGGTIPLQTFEWWSPHTTQEIAGIVASSWIFHYLIASKCLNNQL